MAGEGEREGENEERRDRKVGVRERFREILVRDNSAEQWYWALGYGANFVKCYGKLLACTFENQ